MRGKHNGFSLIELMITLALGTLIVLGVVSLFISNLKTHNLQKNLREIQQQNLVGLENIVQDLRKAGYQVTSQPQDVGVMLEAAGTVPASCNGCTGPADEAPMSDRITVAFDVEVDAGFSEDTDEDTAPRDCEGNQITNTQRLVQTYWLDDERALRCASNVGADASKGVVLVPGVRSFQVLYGVDGEPRNGVAQVTQYLTAAQLNAEAASSWEVTAIRLAYLVEVETEDGQTVQADSGQTYYLLDEEVNVDGSDSVGDKEKVRRQFIRTIPLRNFNEAGV